MKFYFKILAKILIICSIVTSFATGFWIISLQTPWLLAASIWFGVTLGASGAIAAALSLSQILAVRRLNIPISDETLRVHQTKVVEIMMPYERAFELCVSSFRILKGAKVMKSNQPLGYIEALTGVSWKTWGDIISFRLQALDNDHTRIEVSSRPRYALQLVDYGSNLSNVEKISKFLTEATDDPFPK